MGLLRFDVADVDDISAVNHHDARSLRLRVVDPTDKDGGLLLEVGAI